MSITKTVDNVAPDVVRLRNLFVNLYFVGTPEEWVLIDAGLPRSTGEIVEVAKDRFGANNPPRSIILTHGHFDHVGAFPDLLEQWPVPVYAHQVELPHLTGQRDYPSPDPKTGITKGVMALLSFTYPEKAIDLGSSVQALPSDRTVPGLPEWQWIHTPGHTDGHVSLFRHRDRLLIAGDAFVTVQQESIYQVATQKQEVHGPPAYFTSDWSSARRSVEALAALGPATAATGHGTPMSGDELTRGLEHLVAHFDEIAVPDHGKYVPDANATTADR
jgi:glyoxylase-like metal-dependent hydrolase (beta-lactamase superfamily II)